MGEPKRGSDERERADGGEPRGDASNGPDGDGSRDGGLTCHRRGCEEPATFRVLERYQEETGQGAVEAEAVLCEDHTAEEGPTNLDNAYPDYVFRVVPLPGTTDADTA